MESIPLYFVWRDFLFFEHQRVTVISEFQSRRVEKSEIPLKETM